ncbi:prephenate dehydrogenase [uncultured Pseudokineococcus sp.]|uniref:prephenate dehydrogenase n=1 Tax=uncultured Pseudokineococcus sp. TaxID=1642928 RepID=UPI002618B4A1|nr:prephenate dehydrogenase [uncultured Pseudokineococcus sp.]
MTDGPAAPRAAGPGAEGRPARTRGTVLVVGTGLLGASAGLALRARGVDVALDDPSPTARALARDVGAGRPAGPAEDPSVVLVAAPPDVTADVVAARLRAHPRAVVTDVASVKGAVLDGVAAALARDGADPSAVRRYVGGHPMAGRERSGATSARADLFTGRPWVLVPPEGAPGGAAAPPGGVAGDPGGAAAGALERVLDVVADCRGVPVVMGAAAHDEAVALVSHVPQVAASLVAARLLEAPSGAVALAGQGLRDVTRIAASDPGLWVQILGANAAPVARALHALRSDLDAVLGALDALAADGAALGARARVARAIDEGGAGVARVPGKHGADPVPVEVVAVLVPDEPGSLARLFADVADLGVSVEDVKLEHAPGRLLGLAELSVLPAGRPRLEAELPPRGWRVAG